MFQGELEEIIARRARQMVSTLSRMDWRRARFEHHRDLAEMHMEFCTNQTGGVSEEDPG